MVIDPRTQSEKKETQIVCLAQIGFKVSDLTNSTTSQLSISTSAWTDPRWRHQLLQCWKQSMHDINVFENAVFL